MVALLRLDWPVTGGKVAGAVTLSKVPPQAMGLVHPLAFVFVLSEDLARHGTEPVGFVLRFGKGGASDVANLSNGRPRVGPGRQGAQCPAGGQCQFLQGARGCRTQLAKRGKANTEQILV